MPAGRQNSELRDFAGLDREEPRRLLVQRVLASQCFERAARMRDFLAYVCDRSFSDPKAAICEQDIGCAVFRRPASYDTNQDNIVRVNASHPRKRLEIYFASEGRAEACVLELPKGQYTPVFRPRSEPPEVIRTAAGSPDRRLIWTLASLSVLL